MRGRSGAGGEWITGGTCLYWRRVGPEVGSRICFERAAGGQPGGREQQPGRAFRVLYEAECSGGHEQVWLSRCVQVVFPPGWPFRGQHVCPLPQGRFWCSAIIGEAPPGTRRVVFWKGLLPTARSPEMRPPTFVGSYLIDNASPRWEVKGLGNWLPRRGSVSGAKTPIIHLRWPVVGEGGGSTWILRLPSAATSEGSVEFGQPVSKGGTTGAT